MLKHLSVLINILVFSCQILGTHINHGKPFGTGPSVIIDYVDEFLDPVNFYQNFLMKSKPILMKQAAKNFPALKNWNDDYFLNLDLSNYKKHTINVEKRKKENRSLQTMKMNFQEFVRTYNKSDIYMVDLIPTFLNQDIIYPWSLQCDVYRDNIYQVLMWFSSGNTSSVVHTDDMENINCLISGEKTFVLVNPEKHKDKIPIKHEGAYSDIDVDSVDFTKYNQMESVDFIIAKMVAGDCLYIPKLWIHQVRSYHRNIAINIWFRVPTDDSTENNEFQMKMKCEKYPDNQKTFSNTHFLGLNEGIYQKIDGVSLLSKFQNRTVENLLEMILEFYKEVDSEIIAKFSNHIESVMKDIIDEVDRNKNSVIDKEEIETAKSENLQRISNYISYLKTFLESLLIKGDDNSKENKKPVEFHKYEL